MQYTRKAIETKYGGVVFRSRLEARWAAFFDIIGWRWDYEPVDLVGWSPDFSVDGSLDTPYRYQMLLEVKPYGDVQQFRNHPCMAGVLPGWHVVGGLGLNPLCVIARSHYPEHDIQESEIGHRGLFLDLLLTNKECCINSDASISGYLLGWWRDAGNRVRMEFDGTGRRIR